MASSEKKRDSSTQIKIKKEAALLFLFCGTGGLADQGHGRCAATCNELGSAPANNVALIANGVNFKSERKSASEQGIGDQNETRLKLR